MASGGVTSPGGNEEEFIAAVKAMLARPDYVLPISAAERQFRDHYYGLNAAALLEDLFSDAFNHYLREMNPAHELLRPPTGQKGWDYSFDGMKVSHKVGKSISSIAALWDVTGEDVETWSFDEPIVFVLGGNSGKLGIQMSHAGVGLRPTPAGVLGKKAVTKPRSLAVVDWPSHRRSAKVLHVVDLPVGSTVADALPFETLWSIVSDHIRSGLPANELEVLAVTSKSDRFSVSHMPSKTEVVLEVEHRAGVYFLARDLLQELPVAKNNRAILIKAPTMRTLLTQAAANGLFVPLPSWYWSYALDRPPDMYSAQRAEYDGLFSARSRTGDL